MDAPPTATFGDLLRRYRTAAGLTQEELAERAQVSPRAISDLERGQRNRPWRETVRLLAEALKLGPDERSRLDTAARRQRPGQSADVPHPMTRSDPSGARASLPTLLTSLMGREAELAAVGDLLRRDDVRLVTLVGVGGIGKTSLGLAVATQLANEFSDGVGFVPLETVVDPRFVAPAIAQILGVNEIAGQAAWESLAERLRTRRLLLVLDNFEQLLAAAPDLARFLGICHQVNLLVTSRAPFELSTQNG